jgi:hypothetical protein
MTDEIGRGRQSLAQPDTEMIEDTDMTDKQDVGWVAVYIAWEDADAIMIVARLQDEGIPALARPEAASSAIPVTAGMLSQIEVLVPEGMADHALDVLWDLGLLPEQDEAGETGEYDEYNEYDEYYEE